MPFMPAMGLYVHFPFCRRKCRYCDFNSYEGLEGLMSPYVKALCDEMAFRSAVDPAGLNVDTVFFGGGTPTVAGADTLTRVLDQARSVFEFCPDAEITTEANPGTIDPASLERLRAGGFNRLSIGVQASQDKILRAIGRIHSFNQAIEAFRWARAAGFTNIGVDLIYGLPGQTGAMWEESLDAVLELGPEHISTYGLQIEDGTPLAVDIHSGFIAVPDDDETAEMYWKAHARLIGAGYRHYEISNFAKEGLECRHNLHYWNFDRYLGIGAGAHSFDGVRRFSNVEDPKHYISGVSYKGTAEEWSEAVTPARARFEYIMLGLRTDSGVSLDDFSAMFGRSLFSELADLDEMARRGLLEWSDKRLRLTPSGWLVSNALLAAVLSGENQAP